jgi:hypothetical protein
VLEGAVTNTGTGSYMVGSLQLSPGIPPYFRPPLFGFPTASGPGSWYTGLSFGQGGTDDTDGFANNGWYGPPWGSDCPTGCPDALSGGFVNLDNLDTEYWTYRMEWGTGPEGHLGWYYNGNFVWAMGADSFGAYSVCSDRGGVKECSRTPPRQIPQEPMSLVMNTAIGTWNGGQTALDGKHWPAKFWIDYVRVWQQEQNIGCDPPDFPTRKYIQTHAEWYGEPALPSGYDTCPEVYPRSAYKNAEAIKARAAGKAGVALSARAAAGAFFSSFAAMITTNPVGEAAEKGPPSSMVGGMLGVACVAGALIVGATLAVRRQREPVAHGWPLAGEAVEEREYEEFAPGH